jgi:TolA-binding protein
VTTDDGHEVDFGRRREGRSVKVVPTRTVILGMIAALATGGVSVGSVSMWMARAFIAEQIRSHDRDPEAHAAYVRATERLRQSSETSDMDKVRLQNQLDSLQRKIEETREIVIRLEAQSRRTR